MWKDERDRAGRKSTRLMTFAQLCPQVVQGYIQVSHEDKRVVNEVGQFVYLLALALRQRRYHDFDRFFAHLLRDFAPPLIEKPIGITSRLGIKLPIADYRFQLIQHVVHK